MITQELQLLLDEKQDAVLIGMAVPQDGKVGDIRVNVAHGGKFYMMMKAGIDRWLFSAPFTQTRPKHTLEDYLLKSGGKMLDTSLLDSYDLTVRNDLTLSNLDVGHIPYVGAGGLISTDNGQLYWDANNNRLGIGTDDPNYLLHLYADNASLDIMYLQNAGVTAGQTTDLIFRHGGSVNKSASIRSIGVSPSVNNWTALAFYVSGATDRDTLAMYLNQFGYVGINEAGPDERLEVNGNVHITGDSYWTGDGSGVPYGEIYVNDNSTVTSVSNAGFTQFLHFTVNGHSNLSTPDHTNDHITIVKAGLYAVECCVNIKNSSGNAHVIEVVIAKNNGTAIFANMRRHRTLGTGTDVGAIPICGHLDLAVDDTIEVWITSDSAAARDVTGEDIVLMITMVGGT